VPQSALERYNFLEITLATFIAILLSESMIKNKLMVKYIWNVALMVSFMITAITAILTFFRLEGIQGLMVDLHIKVGLVAVWIGIYHAVKHMGSYTKCTPWKKGGCKT
jgi:ABC-type Fe3+ transport system permease subunit